MVGRYDPRLREDGCQDISEDPDDDNDGVPDTQDNCPTGAMGWVSTALNDWDSDGCEDSAEDEDIDNDGILDIYDSCPFRGSGLGFHNPQ